MPKCMPIDTNQHTPTKIIDGCQEIIKILADKKNSCSPTCSYAIWLKLRKRKWNSQHLPPCGKGNLHKVAAPYFCFVLCTIVQLYKEDWGILHIYFAYIISYKVRCPAFDREELS